MNNPSLELDHHTFAHDITKYWLEDCSVCLHPIKHGKSVVKLSHCRTAYHFECFNRWFSDKRTQDRSCPGCRAWWSHSRRRKLMPWRETINPYKRLYGMLLLGESSQEILCSRLQIAYNQQLFDQASLDHLSQELNKLSEALRHTNFPTETAEDVLRRHFPAAQPVEVLLAVARCRRRIPAAAGAADATPSGVSRVRVTRTVLRECDIGLHRTVMVDSHRRRTDTRIRGRRSPL